MGIKSTSLLVKMKSALIDWIKANELNQITVFSCRPSLSNWSNETVVNYVTEIEIRGLKNPKLYETLTGSLKPCKQNYLYIYSGFTCTIVTAVFTPSESAQATVFIRYSAWILWPEVPYAVGRMRVQVTGPPCTIRAGCISSWDQVCNDKTPVYTSQWCKCEYS